MIHVSFVCGHARCSARTSGTTWQVSPSAESLNMQTFRGGRVSGSPVVGSFPEILLRPIIYGWGDSEGFHT